LKHVFPIASGTNRASGSASGHGHGQPLGLDSHRDRILFSGALTNCKPVKATQLGGNNRHCSRLDAIHSPGDHRTIPVNPKPIGGTIERCCDKSSNGNTPLLDLTKSGPHTRFHMKLKGSPSRPVGNMALHVVSHPSAPFTAINLNRGEICLAQILFEEVR